jgi:hypothetical protein
LKGIDGCTRDAKADNQGIDQFPQNRVQSAANVRREISTTLEHSKQRNHVMRKLLVSSAALLVTTVGVALAAEELKSGLQVGDSTTPFFIRDITGPAKGQTLCYR